MAARLNQKQAVRAIADRMTFSAGALNAERVYLEPGSRSGRVGYLQGADLILWGDDEYAGDIVYVVRSYGTPIAWYTARNGWRVPECRYSVTTSRHQGIVRRARAYEDQFATALAQGLAAC